MFNDGTLEEFRIRIATTADVPVLLSFIKALAEEERHPSPVLATEDSLREALFAIPPAAEALLGFSADEPVAFAVFFSTFSTVTGRRGLHLDDLYVRPDMRGRRIGLAMLSHVAKLARERACGRFEWWALRWNERAIAFYQRLGVVPMDELRIFRLEAAGIDQVAGGRRSGDAIGCESNGSRKQEDDPRRPNNSTVRCAGASALVRHAASVSYGYAAADWISFFDAGMPHRRIGRFDRSCLATGRRSSSLTGNASERTELGF